MFIWKYFVNKSDFPLNIYPKGTKNTVTTGLGIPNFTWHTECKVGIVVD